MFYLIAELKKLKVYGHAKDKKYLYKAQEEVSARTPEHVRPNYQIVDEHQLSKIKQKYAERATANRRKGAERAKMKAAGRVAKGLPPKKFITCPTCDAKSKLLFSEMGGVQTRTCQNGHHFEIDTWGGMNDKRRVERTDRPIYTPGQSYTSYIYGRFENDPTGKKS